MSHAKDSARHAATRAAGRKPLAARSALRPIGPLTGIAVGLAVIGGYGMTAASCTTQQIDTSVGGTDEPNKPGPGEICFEPEPEQVKVRFEPSVLFLGPGQSKTVNVVVDPDFCDPFDITFDGTDPSVVAAPDDVTLQYGVPTAKLTFTAGEVGSTTITVHVPTKDEDITETAELTVDVMSDELPACSAGDDLDLALLEAGDTITAAGGLNGASIHLPADADRPNENGFQWSVAPFETGIACAEEIVPGGYEALGPAVRFDPSEKIFPRDMAISIPLNPARMPETARLRHLRVAYQGPDFATPRTFPATNPRVVKGEDGTWRLTFEADRLGTFQAVVAPNAGTVKRTRRITHRAVIGVSMGGAGTQQFGMRHHHLFDVIAPLGGPVDWTWLIHHLEANQLGGFRSIAPGTQLADIPLSRVECTTDVECASDERCIGVSPTTSGACTLMPPVDEAYEHASSFNAWWYEFPGQGHGGSFNREEYLQIFRDLTLMYGNPIGGYNPLAINLPAGVDPFHPSQVGDHPGEKCSVYVDPYDGAGDEADELWQQCPQERCQYVQTLQNYYDDEYNPDGTFPVITFCDGSPQVPERTPYANWWGPEGNRFPMEVALAVDYNGNGVRDELEPIIRMGHESWDDYGTDATPSMMEPGYGPDNRDPAGDDYNPRFNPNGLERDMRWQAGEPYRDHGLDGVDGTAASPYDHGEDDGEFTASPGLDYFWKVDAHSIVRQWPSVASTELDDDALARIDVWTDGGIRDLFNFGVTAEHFLGGFTGRGRDSAYFTEVTELPGLNPEFPDEFNMAKVVWEDVQGAINLRYGNPDLTEYEIEQGSGQHVGTIPELARRIQSALYFIDSRWPDSPRSLVEPSSENPVTVDPNDPRFCETQGTCTFNFTSTDGRTGPVGVNLPPGYGHVDQQGERYPVIFLLHGYGMTPEDLQAAIVFLANWMNGTTDSQASRLGKAIVVYVDGRCRVGDDKAECIRGTFFADSLREDGPQMDKWWRELIDHVDQKYRTMPETQVDWVE
jgi:hypothetical protein